MSRIYGLVLFDGLFDIDVKKKQCDFIYHNILNAIPQDLGAGSLQRGALFNINLSHLPRTIQPCIIVGEVKAKIDELIFITTVATRSTPLGAIARCEEFLLGCDMSNPLHLNESDGIEDDFCLIAYGTKAIPEILDLAETFDSMYDSSFKPKLRLVNDDNNSIAAIYDKKERG